MSIMVGIGRGAHSGILIRDAEALERLEGIDTLVIDKTGTLTEGKPKVTAIIPASGFEADELLPPPKRARRDGATAIFVAVDGRAAGVIVIADPVKPSAKPALAALRADGIRIVMLTGDNATTACAVAATLDIGEVEAGVLPERSPTPVRCGHAQHSAKSRVRVSLQRRRRPDRGGGAVPGVRYPALADGRRGGDGAIVGQRDRQRTAAGADAIGLDQTVP